MRKGIIFLISTLLFALQSCTNTKEDIINKSSGVWVDNEGNYIDVDLISNTKYFSFKTSGAELKMYLDILEIDKVDKTIHCKLTSVAINGIEKEAENKNASITFRLIPKTEALYTLGVFIEESKPLELSYVRKLDNIEYNDTATIWLNENIISLIIIQIVLSIIVAVILRRRKIGFIALFFICILFSPIVGIIVGLISKRKTSISNKERLTLSLYKMREAGEISTEEFKERMDLLNK